MILQLVNDTDSQDYITDMSHKTTLAIVEADLEDSPSNKSYSVTQDDNTGMGEALAQMVIDRSDDSTKENIGIVLAQLIEDERQIVLQMPALCDEHRHDDNPVKSFGHERSDTVRKIGREELEKSQFDAQVGGLRAHCGTNAPKR